MFLGRTFVGARGVDDMLIGAYGANSRAGETYVVFGREGVGAFEATLDLGSLNGETGFTLKGLNASGTNPKEVAKVSSSSSVSKAGDVNGDGIDDILIGAEGANSYAGETYVVFGREGVGAFGATLDLGSLNGTDGFTFRGITSGDYSDSKVSSAGDVNGDGIDDILIGASSADPNDALSAGETYLIYGGDDIYHRFDFADGTKDGVIDLALLELNPADYNPLV